MGALVSLVFTLAGIHVGAHRVLPVGYAPAWSPTGDRIAYVTRGNLWIADADGTRPGLLELSADNPSWSPNGRRLAFERRGWIWTVRADGNDERRLAPGSQPAWSPHGDRIAFDRGGKIFSAKWWYGASPRLVTVGEQPAYAANGRLAYVREGLVMAGGRQVDAGTQPTWAPDGLRLAYARGGQIFVSGRAVARGTQPDWKPAPRVRELLPDLEQRAPSHLTISGGPGHWLLGFTSLVDNVGSGALKVTGVRDPGSKVMTATQHVLLENRRWRAYPSFGLLRYTNSGSHHHWHLLRFDNYELRSADGKLLVRDRKSGFCLADHYGIAPGKFDRHARFLGNCASYNPEAKKVVEGTSVGFTDRYPAFVHGQADNITGLPGGVYVLVHRANPNMNIRELRYENNAASARIRILWRNDVPSVRLLRTCPTSARC